MAQARQLEKRTAARSAAPGKTAERYMPPALKQRLEAWAENVWVLSDIRDPRGWSGCALNGGRQRRHECGVAQ